MSHTYEVSSTAGPWVCTCVLAPTSAIGECRACFRPRYDEQWRRVRNAPDRRKVAA